MDKPLKTASLVCDKKKIYTQLNYLKINMLC